MVGKNNNINIMLNLLKGIACISVVFIHMTFPGKIGEIISKASGYAVPIFFMIAGYYSFAKDVNVITRRLIKIIKIFAYAYAAFFSYGLINAIMSHNVSMWVANNFNWKTPIYYIVFCTINFAVPLWYLIAMIETYLVWLLIVKKQREELTIKLIPILFLFQILLSTYCETKGLAWNYNVNFITRAMPWFFTGYYFHTKKGIKYTDIKTSILIIVAIVGCLIAIIPKIFDLTLDFSCVGYIPFSLSLFVIALKYPDISLCKCLEYIGSRLSLNIYVFHPIIGWLCIDCASNILNIDTNGIVFSWCKPFIVLLLSIIFSFVIDHIICRFITKKLVIRKENG